MVFPAENGVRIGAVLGSTPTINDDWILSLSSSEYLDLEIEPTSSSEHPQVRHTFASLGAFPPHFLNLITNPRVVSPLRLSRQEPMTWILMIGGYTGADACHHLFTNSPPNVACRYVQNRASLLVRRSCRTFCSKRAHAIASSPHATT